jgi:thioesterase domain-containing protein
MGGVVAFELARQLVALGRELAPVVLIDAFVNDEARSEVTTEELTHGFLRVVGVSPALLGLEPGDDRGVEQMLDALLPRAKQAGMIPQSAGRDQVRRYFDVFAANVRALRSYQAGPYDGDLVVLHGAHAGPEKLAIWDRLTGHRVRAVPIAGEHEQLMSPPHVHEIAARLLELGWVS